MTVFLIVFPLLLILSLAVLFGANKFVEMVVHPATHSPQDSLQFAIDHNDVTEDEYNKLNKEAFSFSSALGYTLRGEIIYPEKKTNGKERVVILAHGYSSNKMGMLQYYKIFLDEGFNVVIYDHRWHGDSDKDPQKQFCSMGYYEALDLQDLATFMRQRFGKDCILGIMGESMGAATVMLASPNISNLAFCIEDCGYSSMRAEMKHVIKSRYHLPSFPFIQIGNLIFKHKFGFSMDQVVPSQAVEKATDVPMLFCHGDADTFVPTELVFDVFTAKTGVKQMQLFQGSEHACSIRDHKEQYRELVHSFLKNNKIF